MEAAAVVSLPQLYSLVLVCQAEEQRGKKKKHKPKDPALNRGTYPVTSLVDWRQARRGGGREDSGGGEMW